MHYEIVRHMQDQVRHMQDQVPRTGGKNTTGAPAPRALPRMIATLRIKLQAVIQFAVLGSWGKNTTAYADTMHVHR